MNEKEKFIAELYPEARNISQETGMSWELILAQAALETGWGQKVLPGTYNLFNIKADQGWHGAKKTINNVWEQDRKTGKDIYIDQSFRVYDSYKDALRDRVQFLKSNPRYGKAGYFEDGTLGDLRKEADALQTAGYATDMNYSEKLAKLFASPTMQRGIALAREQEIAQRQSASIRKIGETLREGTKSFSVGELQTRLRHLGYTDTHGRPLQSDHHFGPATRAAVERFQRDHGLVDDGTVGPATQAALRQAAQVAASASLDTHTVRTLQQQLNVLGVTDMNQQAVDVNGVYDLATRTAVARFQSEQGVPVTGQADETTRTLLKSQAFIADLQRLPAFMPATEAETPSRAMAATPALQLGDISPAVHALQHQLNQLGYTDTHGQPLRTDHHFGPRTHAAVQAFQRDHGLDVDGMVGPRTHAMLERQSQPFPSRIDKTYALPERGPQDVPARNEAHLTYADPNHPQHALYARLKELLPPGTTEARLAQSTAACYRGGIKQPQQLHQIHIHDDTVHFLSDRPDARASMDLIQPAPTVQQTMQQAQAYDQQQAQICAQFHAQQAQINVQAHGPVMGGPSGR